MVDCCLPSRCLRYGHRCLSLPLPLLTADAIATVATSANRCPLLLPPQPRDVQNTTFKVIFKHLCCHFLVDCCLPSCCLHYGHCCLPPPLPLLAADAIATGAAAANRCPLPPAPSAAADLLPSLPLSQTVAIATVAAATAAFATAVVTARRCRCCPHCHCRCHVHSATPPPPCQV